MADEFDSLFRLRVRYVKRGRLRFLSHLDVLRACERAVMRSRLPFAISQGFSPRMRIAFGPALPVAVSSDDEWFDLVLTEYVAADSALGRLRACSVDDLMPQEASYVGMRTASLSSALTIACWSASIATPSSEDIADGLSRALSATLGAGEIHYLRNGAPKSVSLAGKIARTPAVESVGEDPGSVRVTFATRACADGSLRPDVFLRDALLRCETISTAGRDDGGQQVGVSVSSSFSDVRVAINRDAQFIEGEDGRWLRPM
jgi:radical SAM-linked protein